MQQSQACAVCGGPTTYTSGGAAANGVWYQPGVHDRICSNEHCEGADPAHQWMLLPEDPALEPLKPTPREIS
ncbi:hypothetical protein AB4Z39_03885 [Mycobacterium adipatum]|uniref:hypothetical protein n=1 Tax=Mycobacterium adipatum TaxID=1682113 RepID=UPI0034E0B3A7